MNTTSDEKFQAVNAQLDEMFENLVVTEAEIKIPNAASLKLIPPVIAGIHPLWWNILTPNSNCSEVLQRTINEITNTVVKPIHRDIFNFARFTPPDDIKVIIIGQDPYDTESHAHGLAFSSQMPETPKSLGNIFKALIKSEYIKSKPATNNLTSWAAQGVLLLNTALTVLPDKPGSHLKLWQPYMHLLLTNLSQRLDKKLVVILWGKEAQAFAPYFNNHHILNYHHPSPCAGDFSDCPNFKECNAILQSMGEIPVDWNPDANKWVEVYTDGSSFPNATGPDVQSGYSAIFTAGTFAHLKLYGRTANEPPYYSNNIRAEGTALLKALQRTAILPVYERLVLHIVSDCEFWIKMLKEYIPSWISKGGIEVIKNYKNPDIVKELWEIYCELQATGTFITISHVYSHDKKGGSKCPRNSTEYRRFLYNKLADSLASHIRQKFQNDQHGEMIANMEFNGEKF